MAEQAGEVRQEELDEERQARRRLALAQIRQYPDTALRMRAREVEEFDADLERLVTRMASLMVDANGVGLAATQVGILRRLFVFQRDEEEIVAVVNPRITARGDEVSTDNEGCLSIQGVLVPVERATAVTLVGQDVAGEEISYDLEGYGARVVQHELDHLDGVLMLDRTTRDARKRALAILRGTADDEE